MHLHGRQRITTVCVHQECRRQVISDIGLVSDLPQVGLAGVSPVVELAPVVCQQDIIRRAFAAGIASGIAAGIASGLPQRLDQIGERDVGIVEKSPGRLRRRGLLVFASKQHRSGRVPIRRFHVLLHHDHIAPVHRRKIDSIQATLKQRKRCLDTNARREGER